MLKLGEIDDCDIPKGFTTGDSNLEHLLVGHEKFIRLVAYGVEVIVEACPALSTTLENATEQTDQQDRSHRT